MINFQVSSHELREQDRIVVVGAGGFTAGNLYLPKLHDLGIQSEQIVLVDNSEERLAQVQSRELGAIAFSDLDHAFEEMHENRVAPAAVIIASNTASHLSNIESITRAAKAGRLDIEKTKVWCEKPLTPPEVFDRLMELKKRHGGLEVNIGYILRFSQAVSYINKYIEENALTINSIDWKYGKDRSQDTRPTQGVFPDEVVHPLSVTDMILIQAFGDIATAGVTEAEINQRDFVNREAQEKARIENPLMPQQPTSDVYTRIIYAFRSDGEKITEVPVTVDSSFLFDRDYRQATLHTKNVQGQDIVLRLDFDVPVESADGKKKRKDIVSDDAGEILFQWGGDKAEAQIRAFLDFPEGDKASLATIETESRIQAILENIGSLANSTELEPRLL